MGAIEEDDDAPSWFDPYPHIAVSEYKDWKEVNDWALSLFRTDPSPSGALGEKIRRIRENSKTLDERTLSALRFVQDEVRYLGIEIGPNTHQPHDASQVFAQRFLGLQGQDVAPVHDVTGFGGGGQPRADQYG